VVNASAKILRKSPGADSSLGLSFVCPCEFPNDFVYIAAAPRRSQSRWFQIDRFNDLQGDPNLAKLETSNEK